MISFADWGLAVDQGRLVEAGAFRELRAKPGSAISKMMDGENGDGAANVQRTASSGG